MHPNDQNLAAERSRFDNDKSFLPSLISPNEFVARSISRLDEHERASHSYDHKRRPSATDHTPSSVATSAVGDFFMMSFGSICLEDRTFDFHLPDECAQWPLPDSGSGGQKRPIDRQRSGRRQLSKRPKKRVTTEWSTHVSPTVHGIAETLPSPPNTSPTSVSSAKASTTHSPHLLGLPGELRNIIWSYVLAQTKQTRPHLRPIHLPKQGHGAKVIRRFPQHPNIAAVNHQTRRELLSLFYRPALVLGSGGAPRIDEYRLTDPKWLQKWTPGPDVAGFMNDVQIRVQVFLERGRSTAIDCDLLKPAKGGIFATFTDTTDVCLADYCTCWARRLFMENIDEKRHVIECAKQLLEVLDAESLASSVAEAGRDHQTADCDACGKRRPYFLDRCI